MSVFQLQQVKGQDHDVGRTKRRRGTRYKINEMYATTAQLLRYKIIMLPPSKLSPLDTLHTGTDSVPHVGVWTVEKPPSQGQHVVQRVAVHLFVASGLQN